MGEVNHTTECVTDLSFFCFEWMILLSNSDFLEVNGYSENVTPLRLFAVGEVTLSKDEPLSVDLTMFPEKPTTTKVLFPKVTPGR